MVPWIYRDCGGALEVAMLGCSLGAFHAANFALRRADLFPLAMCFSGSYDPSCWRAWGERGAPHGRPSWRAQVAQHMPRFC
ncbi:MAG: alpha/beta hydrolase-fold protein [Streptosporangiaceae bacterium]